MALITVTFSGDETPSAVVLRDPANTYGVRRTDTSGVVVAAGTAMTEGADGVWTYEVTEPAAGLTYQYAYRATFADAATFDGGGTVDGEASGDPTISDFTTVRSVKNFGGPFNVVAYWDKDATQDEDAIDAAALEAGQTTDAEIRNAWRKRLADAGATFTALSGLTLDDDETVWLRQTANWGIVVHSYEGRGELDVGEELDGKMAKLRQRYEARLKLIESGDALLVAQADAGVTDTDATDAGAWSSVPMVFGPEGTTDEYAS